MSVQVLQVIREFGDRLSGRCLFAAGVLLGLLTLGGHAALTAQEPTLRMLDGLTKGEWTIRPRGDAPVRKICLKSGAEFIQLRHSGQRCSHVIVTDTPSEITVQYKCGDDGYARTRIRRETRELVQLDSHGIAGDQPFQFAAEARRTGQCP